MKVVFIISIGIFLSSCAASYNQQILKDATSKLERSKGVFISTPKNGWYGKIEYKNSGKMTANAVKAAFSRFSNSVYISDECLGLECLKTALTNKYAYYVVPEILHWEDRATEWSGMPDRIDVKISVYDVTLGSEISSTEANGQRLVGINRRISYQNR